MSIIRRHIFRGGVLGNGAALLAEALAFGMRVAGGFSRRADCCDAWPLAAGGKEFTKRRRERC